MSHTVFFTIGHSNRSSAEFIDLLHEHSVQQVVDVRKLPGSNRYPQFNADALGQELGKHHIKLTRSAGLTGRRKVSKDVDFAVNGWWRNRSFHNYADHALSTEFQEALTELCELGAEHTTAVMCSEAVWWRCHRRIIADYLLASNHQVEHIMGPDQLMTAELSTGAVPQADGTVEYPSDEG